MTDDSCRCAVCGAANAKMLNMKHERDRLREALKPLVRERNTWVADIDADCQVTHTVPYAGLSPNTEFTCVMTKAELEAAVDAAEGRDDDRE